jgi:hypothetical protein
MKIGNRQQLLGIFAIVAVVLLAGDRLVYEPLAKAWKERTAQVVALKKSVAQGSLLLERERSIRSRWDLMRTNTLSDELSVAENQVLYAFDRWSQDSRIGITSVKPQWKRTAEDYATLECRVDAFGTLPALTRFLYEIERDSLGLKVDAVEITARDDRGEQLTMGLQVSGLQLNPVVIP